MILSPRGMPMATRVQALRASSSDLTTPIYTVREPHNLVMEVVLWEIRSKVHSHVIAIQLSKWQISISRTCTCNSLCVYSTWLHVLVHVHVTCTMLPFVCKFPLILFSFSFPTGDGLPRVHRPRPPPTSEGQPNYYVPSSSWTTSTGEDGLFCASFCRAIAWSNHMQARWVCLLSVAY